MTNIAKTTAYITIPILACFILFVLEQIMLVDYITKTCAKLLLFLGIPLLVHIVYKQDIIYRTSTVGLTSVLPGICIGAGVIVIILIAYLLFKSYIDAGSIMAELNEKSRITKETYLYTGIYISLGNSFLEEFFFRKYIFLGLYRSGSVKLAYVASALLFSVYHLAIFNTWFSPTVLLLALLGLLAAGLILNYITAKTGSLLSSWIIHICSNIAIIGIGWSWL